MGFNANMNNNQNMGFNTNMNMNNNQNIGFNTNMNMNNNQNMGFNANMNMQGMNVGISQNGSNNYQQKNTQQF